MRANVIRYDVSAGLRAVQCCAQRTQCTKHSTAFHGPVQTTKAVSDCRIAPPLVYPCYSPIMSSTKPSTILPFTMNEKAPAPQPVPQTPVSEGRPRRWSASYVLWRILVATVLLWVGWNALSGIGNGMYWTFRYFHPARSHHHGHGGPDMKARTGCSRHLTLPNSVLL